MAVPIPEQAKGKDLDKLVTKCTEFDTLERILTRSGTSSAVLL